MNSDLLKIISNKGERNNGTENQRCAGNRSDLSCRETAEISNSWNTRTIISSKVRLQGHCAGCPGAQMTIKGVVEKILKESYPEVAGVEAV